MLVDVRHHALDGVWRGLGTLQHGRFLRHAEDLQQKLGHRGIIRQARFGALIACVLRPTAFVCNCDLTASLLIKKLRENGYRVPEDISVVGFDNYLYPGLSDIRITTYEVDMGEMARRALHNMIKKITSDNYKSGVTVVEGRLVLKDSVSHV